MGVIYGHTHNTQHSQSHNRTFTPINSTSHNHTAANGGPSDAVGGDNCSNLVR